jgi:hypothetical protein
VRAAASGEGLAEQMFDETLAGHDVLIYGGYIFKHTNIYIYIYIYIYTHFFKHSVNLYIYISSVCNSDIFRLLLVIQVAMIW